jgi:hypothetical protein
MANLDVTVDGNLTNNTAPDFAADRILYIDAGTGTLQDIIPQELLTALVESAGPTVLAVGPIADGQALVRSGSTIVGSSAFSNILQVQVFS